MSTTIERVNGTAADRPAFDPIALAEAEAIRSRAEAEAEALRVEAAGKARAAEILAEQEAEKQRLANERARMKNEKDAAAHERFLAEQAAKKAAADAAAEKANREAAEEEQQTASRAAEQVRSERMWKWGARAIYGVCLVIAAPVQFMDFWDKKRPFLVAAPAMLEGIALVLACGAAWAVAHRRDVAPYRVGIMLGAAIAATINLRGGLTNPALGFNAGLIGAISSLVGPIVLMAYEHGIAQKTDGIPSWRERRAEKKRRDEEAAEKAAQKKAREDAQRQAEKEKAEKEKAASEEQARRDADRKQHHADVWEVAEALRSARGSATVTEQIWADAWYRVTGSKTVGITADIEARSKAAQARMKAATDLPVLGDLSQVKSQRPQATKRDPDAPDGRRNNGGTPPRRTPGDTQPPSQIARRQASLERLAKTEER